MSVLPPERYDPDTKTMILRRNYGVLDRCEMPCVDCAVGKPHTCPLLYEVDVDIYLRALTP